MLQFVVPILVVTVGKIVYDEAKRSNSSAKKKYRKTKKEATSKVKHHYINAEKQAKLDSLYKVKKAKSKIVKTIKKELKKEKKNYSFINSNLKDYKEALDRLFNEKKVEKNRHKKIEIQDTINLVIKARKETFKTRDSIKSNITYLKNNLHEIYDEINSINKEISKIKQA